MHIFRATDIRISAIPIVADDIQHASHLLLKAFHDGLLHWPEVTYALGPWDPPADMQPEILRQFADDHSGGLAHFEDNGWSIISTARPNDFYRDFDA
ncbi:MAG: hypothetical protein ABGW87_12720 [Sphingomonadaceae bacterium]